MARRVTRTVRRGPIRVRITETRKRICLFCGREVLGSRCIRCS